MLLFLLFAICLLILFVLYNQVTVFSSVEHTHTHMQTENQRKYIISLITTTSTGLLVVARVGEGRKSDGMTKRFSSWFSVLCLWVRFGGC